MLIHYIQFDRHEKRILIQQGISKESGIQINIKNFIESWDVKVEYKWKTKNN